MSGRVVHLVTSLLPEHGGVARIVPALAAAQRRQGAAEVAVVTRAADVGALATGDLLHLHGLWEPELWRGAVDAASGGAATAWTLHGMLDRWSRAQRGAKKRLAWLLYQRGLLRRAAAVVVNTAHEREEAAEWLRGPAVPWAVLPNGVEPPPPGADGARFREAWGIPPGAPLLLFFGRLHRKKGVELLPGILARVAARHPDARLAVVGPEDAREPGLGARLDAAFAAEGVGERVVRTGLLDGAARHDALAAADVALFPSAEEGMSMAILEALAAGAPVVITPACRMEHAVAAGAARVAAREPAPFADVASALLGAPPARRVELADAARAVVRDRHSWDAVARDHLALYADAGLRVTRATAPPAARPPR